MEIRELELQTAMLPLLKEFYTHTLGFDLIEESPTAFCVAAGVSRLIFEMTDNRAEGPYHFAFLIPYDKMVAAQAWLQERVKLLPDPSTSIPLVQHELWQAQALYFLDPEGNILEFIGHSTLPANPNAAPFDAGQVLQICEMGLVVPHVPEAAKQLKEKLGIKRWHAANEKFEAVGDAHGLLILVEEERAWFPTQLAARVLPVRLLLQTHATYEIRQSGEGRLAVSVC